MKRLIIVVCVLLTLCGCKGAKELEELQIVAGLYLDITEDGTLRVTAETVDFTGGMETPAVYSAEGMGIGECMTRMMDQCGRKLYLSHAEVVVVSRDYVDTRLRELTEYMLHDNDLRFTTAIVVSLAETASAFVETEAAGEEVQSYIIAELLQNSGNTGRTINKEGYVAIRELYDIGETTVLPAIALEENRLRAQGSVVVGANGMVVLGDTETMLLNLLCGNLERGSLGLSMNGQNISVDITDCKTCVDCDMFDDVVKYRADTTLSLEVQAAYDTKALEQAVRVWLQDAVYALYDRLREAQADAFGAARILRGRHPEQYRTMEGEPIFAGSVAEFHVEIHTGEVVY